MTAPLLLTYKDLLDQANDFLGQLNQGLGQRELRGCVQTGYDELAMAHKWVYLMKVARIVTQSPQTTGTVQYTHSAKQFVLTGATWPSWANQGTINALDVLSEIVSVAGDNVTATADSNLNPGQDVAAGTAYTLAQDAFLLPSDFQLASSPISESCVVGFQYIRPDEWLELRRIRQAVGQPTLYTFLQDQRYYGNVAIGLYPAPDRVLTLDVIYKAMPRALKYSGEENGLRGTATITASVNTATLNTGTLTANQIGSVFRIRSDSNEPTGRYGMYPFDEQKVITGVAGSVITFDTAFRSSYSAGKFIVSDPVDVSPNMVHALIRGVERQCAIKRRMDQRVRIEESYFMALSQAKSADSRSNERRSMWDSYPSPSRRIARWPKGADL